MRGGGFGSHELILPEVFSRRRQDSLLSTLLISRSAEKRLDISLLYPYKPYLIDTPLDDMASQDKTPEVGPATLPTSKPKSPTIHGGFATIATPANNIGGDPVSAYRRVRSLFALPSRGQVQYLTRV